MPLDRRLAGLLLPLLLTLAAPTLAEETEEQSFDEFWNEEQEPAMDLPERLGSGAGPMMVWVETKLDAVNAELERVGLLALPEQELYWGGGAWFSIPSGGPLTVALGGAGYGGGGEAERGANYASWSMSAGYFSVKGIYPAHRHLYIEGGVQLGGGSSSIVVESSDPGDGTVNVHLRGDRYFLLMRGAIGLDIRLARWIGILVEGGYGVSSGDWNLDVQDDRLGELEFQDSGKAQFMVMVRFGI